MGCLRTDRLFRRDWHQPNQKQGCSSGFNQCWIFPLPWSLSVQITNILDAYLQRCYVKRSDKKDEFHLSPRCPEPSESTECFLLSLTRERSSFLCHQCGVSFFALHIGTIAKKRRSNSQQWQTVACLEFFPYVTLIYHLRLTFKIIFSALNVELKPEMDSDDYLQISKLQKPINCLAVWANCSRLCLPMLFFCRKAKPTRLFWLTCFYSFLVCFYSCGFAKLLHPVLN